MKTRIIFAVTALAIMTTTTAMGQLPDPPHVPPIINYQGRLTDDAGVPLTDTSVNLIFRIYDHETAVEPVATLLWDETHNNVVVNNGLFSVLLGASATAGEAEPLDLADFDSDDLTSVVSRWLEVEVDGEVLTPRKELVSVVYAFNSDMVDGLHAAAFAAAGHSHCHTDLTCLDSDDHLHYLTVARHAAIDSNLAEEEPTATERGEPTRTEIEEWGDRYDWDADDHALVDFNLGEEEPGDTTRGEPTKNEIKEWGQIDDNNPEEEAPGDTTRGEPTKNEIRSWGQLDDANPAEEAPTATERGEPTRTEIEDWGDRYDWDQDDHALVDFNLGEEEPTATERGEPTRTEIEDWGDTYDWDQDDHALIDHTALETDPQVDDYITVNRVPRWDGSKLVTGSITDYGIGDIAIEGGTFELRSGDFRIQTTPGPWPYVSARQYLALRADDNYTVLVPSPNGLRVTDYVNFPHRNNLILTDGGQLQIPRSNVVAWAFNTWSDSRVKLNQEPLSKYGLTEVLALRVKEYDLAERGFDPETGEIDIKKENTKKDFGLIAQEVDKVIPEAVSRPEDETKNLWSLDYGKLIPVLIKAIQEQQQTIKDQDAKIDSLEKRIETLEASRGGES